MTALENRRPLKTRGAGWAQALARALAAAGVSPDAISALSLVFAAAGAGLFAAAAPLSGWARSGVLIGAAVCVQLRLLANMLDGMVAVEHGRGSAAGPIWNELPDRIADLLFLVAAGYAVQGGYAALGPVLGWICGALAVLTAYVRELGRGLGFAADFSGPMAKPHRMAALTATCVIAALAPLWRGFQWALPIGLALIALGTAATVVRRTRRLASRLGARGPA
ncbi:MAG TPA: CDP-alcohol phosphatidyltransferase family protein [Caulobacteraceae bacterium]|nr:CDP-alcohol phosphatidyltransferase family protein [Caulobacteraceae bacterium]